jgi:hypothetical protein
MKQYPSHKLILNPTATTRDLSSYAVCIEQIIAITIIQISTTSAGETTQ